MTWPVPFSHAMNTSDIAEGDYKGPSWNCPRVVHAALDGEPMPVDRVPNAAELWAEIAGGRPWPTQAPRKYLICGSRRISKTREYVARRAAWRCATFEPRGLLAPGEVGVASIVCPDRDQGAVALEFARAFLEQSPLLRPTIEKVTAHEIRFTTRTALRITTATTRQQRGHTCIDVKDDEGAHFWDSDSNANPLSEILAAQEPAMGTVAGAQLGITSTPRGRNGEFYRLWQHGWGKADPRFLVLTIPWQIGNPLLDAEMVRAAFEADPAVAAAEWGARWRDDVEGYVSRVQIDQCTEAGVRERAPVPGVSYVAFADPSGGSADSFTLAIAHRDEDGRAVLDTVRETKPPFSPDETVRAYAECCRAYGVHRVTSDRYSAGWAAERWAAAGIQCVPSEYTKSELYVRLLPMLNSGRCVLLDHQRLANQLLSLERRVSRGGSREIIDSPPKLHEDLANSAAGALVLSVRVSRGGGDAVPLYVGHGSGFALTAGSDSAPRYLPPIPYERHPVWTYGSGLRNPIPEHLRRTK